MKLKQEQALESAKKEQEDKEETKEIQEELETKKKPETWRSMILDMELKLCSKML